MIDISIIIPVYNESKWIDSCCERLRRLLSNKSQVEILFVDGGSEDDTLNQIFSQNEKVIPAERGRAKQMNKGASIAKGRILYFLHVDSIPPQDFDLAILQAVSNGAMSGCFRMKFDVNHWLLNISGYLTRFSSDWCRGGDQSLFVKKEAFERIGGFDSSLRVMEDNEVIPRLKKSGKFYVIPKSLVTSARRYEEVGVVKLQWIYFNIHKMYRQGASQEELINYYNKKVLRKVNSMTK